MFHHPLNAIHNRFRRTGEYQSLKIEHKKDFEGAAGLSKPDVSCADNPVKSTASNANGASAPIHLEHLNRDLIAFGMVCPKIEKTYGCGEISLDRLMKHLKIEKISDSGDDMAVHGKYSDSKHEVGVSVMRDGAGGLAFQIYELPETLTEDRTFNENSYNNATRIIRRGIQRVSKELVFDDDGNIKTDRYTVFEEYHPRLKIDSEEAMRLKKENDLKLHIEMGEKLLAYMADSARRARVDSAWHLENPPHEHTDDELALP